MQDLPARPASGDLSEGRLIGLAKVDQAEVVVPTDLHALEANEVALGLVDGNPVRGPVCLAGIGPANGIVPVQQIVGSGLVSRDHRPRGD